MNGKNEKLRTYREIVRRSFLSLTSANEILKDALDFFTESRRDLSSRISKQINYSTSF